MITTEALMVSAITRCGDARHSFTLSLRLVRGGYITLRGCQLIGPSITGGYSIYGPSRVQAGNWTELVDLPNWVRVAARAAVMAEIHAADSVAEAVSA